MSNVISDTSSVCVNSVSLPFFFWFNGFVPAVFTVSPHQSGHHSLKVNMCPSSKKLWHQLGVHQFKNGSDNPLSVDVLDLCAKRALQFLANQHHDNFYFSISYLDGDFDGVHPIHPKINKLSKFTL